MACPCCGQVDCGFCNGVTGGCGANCYSNSGVEEWCGSNIVRDLVQQCIPGVGFGECSSLLYLAPQDTRTKYAGCYCMVAQSRCDTGLFPCCKVFWQKGFSEVAGYVWLKDKCLWEKIYVELNEVANTGCVVYAANCSCPPPPVCTPPQCPDTFSGRNDVANNIRCVCNNPFP